MLLYNPGNKFYNLAHSQYVLKYKLFKSRTIKKKVSFGLNDAVVKVSSDTCQIDSTLLKKVIEWATYHRNDEKYDKYPDDVVSWDADFLNVDKHTLFSLTAAANHLDIKVIY